jgi:hypothetical protein
MVDWWDTTYHIIASPSTSAFAILSTRISAPELIERCLKAPKALCNPSTHLPSGSHTKRITVHITTSPYLRTDMNMDSS